MGEERRQAEVSRAVLAGVRYVVPAAIVVAGLVLATLGATDVAQGAGPGPGDSDGGGSD